jgi:beta-lactamase regulating signal transducer with metallopeptidase domain
MNPAVQILGWTLIHALWQDTLLVLLVALSGVFLRNSSRHLAHGLVLCLCLILPFATAWHFHRVAPVGWGPAAQDIQTLEAAATDLPRTIAASLPMLVRWEAFLQPRLPILVVLWAVGASLMALRLGGGYALSLRWKQRGTQAPPEWQGVVDALAKRMGIRRPVRLLTLGWGNTPMVLGLWKPVVLMPVALLANLPPDYLEALLAHELAHVRRLDFLSNFFQGIVETLLFFHPAIWWLSARIRAEREELADHLAAQNLGEPRRLALALNALDDLQPAFPQHLFPVLAARGGHLLTRIQRLLSPRPSVSSQWGLLTLLLVPCTVFALRAAVPTHSSIPVPASVVAHLDALATKEGLDPQLLRSMAWVESGFDAKAKSSMGATGLLQVMPETARAYGAKDLNDPA